MHNISVAILQYNLNAIKHKQHTINVTISPLRNTYPTINEYSNLELVSHTNMEVQGQYVLPF